ncbi:hypothetical protein [Undibacterium umbellatum]|uniref:Uncharacterized protein n=1 Tax=Undibacterium umbellatum TaxID=2762300 RepID=A0ABR6Z7T3_9BURK|nr:hypothetical protein [Undibacterium umbellatum]MBC3907819.1 hypothetical protein [Undibacterium umbellatum]
MNLLQKYIHAVKLELPQAQREDIGRELQANILDQLDAIHEQTGREASQDDVVAVLEKHGHPAQVAARYAPVIPLVSSELMPAYKLVMSYALGITLLLQTLKSGTVFLAATHYKVWQALMQLLAGFIEQGALVFTSVTLVFYLAAKSGMLPNWASNKGWRVQDLPEQEHDWQRIRGSDIITDLSGCGFILLLIWHKFWMSEASLQQLRVDFSPAITAYLPWMSLLLIASVVFGIWCASQPVWSKLKLQLNILQNSLYVILFLIFSQLDALIVSTGTPTIVDLQGLGQGIQLGCLAYALYLVYECWRDARRYRLLSQQQVGKKIPA